MTDYGKVRGMRDITAAFSTACQGLAPSQVIKVKDLTMMDAMNALTLMDPRMDTGCLSPPGPSTEGSIGQWQLWERLLPEEVCAIMDKLMSCEMSYHSGQTLVNTVLPSLHLQSLSTLRSPSRSIPPDPLLTLILRPYLLSLHLCLNLTWHELIRGNVYDGEDFMSDCYGAWESGKEWEVERGEEVGDVVEMLEKGEEWLVGESGLGVEVIEQLVTRLRLRKGMMLHLIVLLSGGAHAVPIPLPPPLLPILSQLQSLPPLPTSAIDSPRVTSSFDWNISRRYRQTMPVASPSVFTWPETLFYLSDLVNGLEICSALGYEESLLIWTRTLRSLISTCRPTLPIIRSTIMATLNPTPQTVLFGYSYPTTWMSDTLLQVEAGLAPGRLPGLAMQYDVADPGKAKGLRGFQDRLAGNLINGFSIMCQNRARQRRFLLSSAVQWEELYLNCPGPSVLPPSVFEAIRGALARHRLDLMMDGVLAGLDLELIDEDEWLETFWWLRKLADDRVKLGGQGYQHEWAEAWACFSKAIVMLLVPTSTDALDERKEAMSKARFKVRFKWASVKPFDGDGDFSRARHDLFQDDMDSIAEIERGKRKDVAATCFTRAAVLFRLLKRHRVKSPLPSGVAQAELTQLMWLAETANQNQLKLANKDVEDEIRWKIKDDVDGRYRFWCPAIV